MQILERFEQRGLRIVGLKLLSVSESQASEHYGEHEGKFFFEGLVQHLQSGPVIGAVLEGAEVISIVRAMVGSTRPHEAAPGTIRGDFAVAGLRNLVHGSDAAETAAKEIRHWFRDEELASYGRGIDAWIFEA